jgi:hypothetical protein
LSGALGASDDVLRCVTGVMRELASAPGEAPLQALRPAIDQHFAADTVAAILASLEAERRPEFADWARETRALLDARSPTMLCVALEQLRRGRHLSFADSLRMEIGMAQQSFVQGDFVEGIRALVIDKDNAPRWRPPRVAEVTPQSVAEIFRDPFAGQAHPLAHLEGESIDAAQ